MKNIRYYRELKMCSQEKLMHQILSFSKLSRESLSLIETGRSRPQLKTVWTIARGLEITPMELFTPIEELRDRISLLVTQYQVSSHTEKIPEPSYEINHEVLKEVLGKNIRYHRRRANISDEEFLEKLGRRCKSLISVWEKGRDYPPTETLYLISRILGVSILELVTPRNQLSGRIAALAEAHNVSLPLAA
ncbi:MAG: transcriptional regulator [Candidatus Yonathbacteria bacterium]|nr:transcriptional regulator [Candidatus Yonathbacteria bacterium]